MFALPTTMTVALVALTVERLLGFPSPLRRLIGHPIDWLTRFVSVFDALVTGETGSRAGKVIRGTAFCLLAVTCSGVLAFAFVSWLRPLPYAWCWEGIVAVPFLQQYATRVRARTVSEALARDNFEAARSAALMFTPAGEAPQTEPQAVRRTVEMMAHSLATNIVTPLFWLALFGLPGIICVAALDAINRHTANDPGTNWCARTLLFAARFLPGKIAGVMVAGAASLLSPAAGARALEHIHEDGKFDQVRDANWSRAAFAGALDIRLGGPEIPGQTLRTDHWIGTGERDPGVKALRAAQRLLANTLTLLTVLMAIAAAFA
jgi:adenosylcobinamide-phosphate synthase